jgi:SAM-dependent methyltransferase
MKPGFFSFLGFSKNTFINNVKGIPSFVKDYKKLKAGLKDDVDFSLGELYPITTDKDMENGNLPRHYFYQDILVAQKIFKNKPQKHVDIGSRIDGFVAHVAAYREIELFDIRPISRPIANVKYMKADLTKKIDKPFINYTDSLSSLHAIEHFGLGRYGDAIDAYGHIKALDNIYMILKSGGRFYFSVPIGTQRIEFNAHRIFSLKYLYKILLDKFDLVSFSYIDDDENLHEDVTITPEAKRFNFGCQYGCGIFELIKK